MPSKTTDMQKQQPSGRIAEKAAEASRAAAHRAAGVSSELLRAREIPSFTLGNDRTDVRGWQVYSNDAELVGTVSSIFVDMRAKAVRYIGISLHATRTKAQAREILVPIGWVSRPDDRQVVVVTALSSAQLMAAPRVSDRPVTRADEYATLTVYGMLDTLPGVGLSRYDGPLFEQSHLFGTSERRAALA